jgi:hypothetical protein
MRQQRHTTAYAQMLNLTESQTKGREGKRQASDMMSDSDFSGGLG